MSASPGKGLKITGICLVVLGGLLYFVLGGADENPFALVAVPVMIAGVLSHFRGRKQAARGIAQSADSPLRDSRADVLYLRCFRADASSPLKVLVSGFTTEEEDLADAVKPIGDLIAVGQPGEPLPLPGATRMYCSNEEWQGAVLERMRVAPLVVLRAGGGAGLLWECQRAFEMLPPQRLAILVLHLGAAEYEHFASDLKNAIGVDLPSIPRCSLATALIDVRNNPSRVQPGFIAFSNSWQARFLPLPLKIVRMGVGDLTGPFRAALQPILAAAHP